MLWGLLTFPVWTFNKGGKVNSPPLLKAAAVISKVSGIVGIIGSVIAVLFYTSIVKQADAIAASWDASNNWATTSTNTTKVSARLIKLSARAMFFNSFTQIAMAGLTSKIVAKAASPKICKDDDGEVIDCPKSADDSADAPADDSADADNSSSSDFSWL